jgi:hypothetical protein
MEECTYTSSTYSSIADECPSPQDMQASPVVPDQCQNWMPPKYQQADGRRPVVAHAQVRQLEGQLRAQPRRCAVKDLEQQVGALREQLRHANEERDRLQEEFNYLDGMWGDTAVANADLRDEAGRHNAVVAAKNREMEDLRAAAPALLEPLGAIPTSAVGGYLLQLQQRGEGLRGLLAERQAGPQLHVPDGAAGCPVCLGANTPEVQLGCGNGHVMCRPCYWSWCTHTALPSGDNRCPMCRVPCLLPAQ